MSGGPVDVFDDGHASYGSRPDERGDRGEQLKMTWTPLEHEHGWPKMVSD